MSSNSTDIPINRMLRDARRRAGLTQADLAAQAGCKQSAVSMMEGGQMTALSRQTLEAIAEILNITLPEHPFREPQQPVYPEGGSGYCPNAACLSNMPYLVGEELFFLPRYRSLPERHCSLCGEVIARFCPGCRAPVARGWACCTACGTALVEAPNVIPEGLKEWVTERRRLALELDEWLQSELANE